VTGLPIGVATAAPIVDTVRDDERDGSVFVVGDVHGHLDELISALHEAGLVTTEGHWSGGHDTLWFLGDFVDRGPDGIGVIELVMRLADQAEQASGKVGSLLGNHEVLLLGMHLFGDTPVPSDYGFRSFARSWHLNGGQLADQTRLTDRHVRWLTDRPVAAIVDDHLLLHSDTTAYLSWGDTVDQVNSAVHEIMHGRDLVDWWDCWHKMTTRFAFRGVSGAQTADELMGKFGGGRIVHGHSIIADQLGIQPEQVDGPLSYADDKVLAVDGGLFDGGPCLVVRL
jgi:Calcineurin-like phosphoesterase